MSNLSFPEIFERLLKARGINENEKDFFINPDYGRLHNPLDLPDMEVARDRLIRAIEENERIAVFSDYDADGIPGAVVMDDFFKKIGYKNYLIYIPHRHDEGFGLNEDFINDCGARLIITVDCGTADHKEIDRAQELGIDVIVTDHHESNELPKALAVVNPKRADSKYPFKELCGSAIAYKLVQAVLEKNNFGLKKGMEKWSLDMVGIATLSDMVPLVDENRIFAKYGLDVLRKSPRPGLAALIRRLNLDRSTITEDDIAFMITPRINAASRMGVPQDAFMLLSTISTIEAEKQAAHLEKINNERKGVVAAMVKEAKKNISEREQISDVIVVGNPDWRPSLAGLVANSLVEEFCRPAFVWGRDGDGVIKGSCRSYNGYDLFKLMEKVGDNFIEFGGHAGAGGFSISLEKLATLEGALSSALADLRCEAEKDDDAISIELKDVGEDLWKTVSAFAPFGTGNEKPLFKISNAPVKSIRQFGKEKNHLEIGLGNGTKAIAFFATPESFKLEASCMSCTLYAHMEKSYFRNSAELRLRIVDIVV